MTGGSEGGSGWGAELHRWEIGRGSGVLGVHETAATGEVWRPLAAALGGRARLVAYDRRGWGRSGAPEPYLRTSVEEQAEDAAGILRAAGAAPAVVCGAGLGAVVALDLAIRHPELVRGSILLEPPLLSFVPEATEPLSQQVLELREAAQRGGPRAALELYLSGALDVLGPGAGRLPEPIAAVVAERPLSLFAELATVPAWTLPLTEMAGLEAVVVAVADSTPPLVRTAAERVAERIGGADLRRLQARGLPQDEAAAELAELVVELG